jgi:hypothetical protein
MNEHDLASNPPATAPASSGNVTGQARVEHLGGEPGTRAESHTQAPWGATAAPAASGLPRNTLLGDFVGRVLGFVGDILNPQRVQRSIAFAKRWGHYAVLAGGALTLAYAIFAAIRANSFATFTVGLGLVAAIAVAQYAAMRFLDAADALIASTPSRVVSSAFLECAGLMLVMLAASAVLGGTYAAIASRALFPLLPALLSGVVFTALGALALHPGVVNNHPGTGTAGEEAIGLLSFAAKAALKVAPLYFALFAATGALAVLWSFFATDGAFSNAALIVLAWMPVPLPSTGGLSGSALIVFACLVPMFAYAGFLMSHLAIDLLRAVLSLPGKLDGLRR